MEIICSNHCSDSAELCNLFNVVFNQNINQDQWNWKYCAPHRSGSLHVIGMRENGDAVAHVGAIALPGWINGASCTMVQICDVMIQRSFRTGIGQNTLYARLMSKIMQEAFNHWPDGFIYGFPGSRPFKLGERLGFYSKIFEIHERIIPSKFTTGMLRQIRSLEWNSPRVEIIEENMLENTHCPRVARSREHLIWRYKESPMRKYKLLALKQDKAVVGWFILCSEGRNLRIVDAAIEKSKINKGLHYLQGWAWIRGYKNIVTWLPLDNTASTPTGIIAMQMGRRLIKCDEGTFMPGDVDIY